jgi:hypothetical protein
VTIALAIIASFEEDNDQPTIVERYRVKCSPFGGHSSGVIELDNSGRWWYDSDCRRKMCFGHYRLETNVSTVRRLIAEGQLERVTVG